MNCYTTATMVTEFASSIRSQYPDTTTDSRRIVELAFVAEDIPVGERDPALVA
jgi:hypothetical protein